MRKWCRFGLGVALLFAAGCVSGGSDDSAADAANAAPSTVAPCPEGSRRSLKGCVPIETTTTTTIAPEQAAFKAEYAKMPEEMRLNFTGDSSEEIAVKICNNQAELMYVGTIGVEHYPDVARAGYAWRCPERVAEHDAAVLRAIAEDARRRAAATSTAPPPPPAQGSGETVSQGSARDSAASYLRNVGGFSRSALIEQLLYEGFSQADATYAVDVLNVDWNAQAAQSAASYMRNVGGFSRSGLIEQLLYEGFTPAQAEYGVSTTGL